ncbi:MAG TPA: phosphoribosylanthranilate isomerase [Gemmatimonadaceae bacterium]|nr:phosphoribosylanthranilate isomerase [Gemmatimonadaceae bacterium]
MDSAFPTRIKICCMASIAEAALALEAGADALGFVMRMPSGPGPIAEELAREIIATVPDGVPTLMLTSEIEAKAIIAQLRATGANTVQIVDYVTPGTRQRLRDAMPALRIVQVVHVTGPESVDEACIAARTSDMILLDSGNRSAKVKELGGTGRIHDWTVSREIRESIEIPLWLAGGLRAENVREAIDAVRPYGVDVCSGVRTGGPLDAQKVRAFASAVRGSS